MAASFKTIATKLIHAGTPRPRVNGAVVTPVFQSSTYEYLGEAKYHDVRYIRLNNTPNHLVLNARLAALENAEAALVTASGMAAISTALMSVLSSGDHLLAMDCLYGGTHGFVTKDLPLYGVSHTFVDGHDTEAWKRALRPTTRAFYVETMTNPLIQIPDLEAVVRFAKAHGLISMIDNTFATPVNFRPPELGFDLSLHSCTKYLNGHSDLVAGAAIGRAELIEGVKHRLDHLGGSLDPHACFLLERGMKTLAVRVRYQNESAARIAAFLARHPAIERVNHPSLESHPQHRIAARLFEGFGGMMSFVLKGGVEAAERLFKRCTIPIIAVSLGGCETLMIRPAAAIHSGLSADERAKSGISDALVRLSVGLESTDELIEDFEQALSN